MPSGNAGGMNNTIEQSRVWPMPRTFSSTTSGPGGQQVLCLHSWNFGNGYPFEWFCEFHNAELWRNRRFHLTSSTANEWPHTAPRQINWDCRELLVEWRREWFSAAYDRCLDGRRPPIFISCTIIYSRFLFSKSSGQRERYSHTGTRHLGWHRLL